MERLGTKHPRPVNIFLNGEQRDIQAATVSDLVTSLQLPAAVLLIEHNGIALHRDEWETQNLKADDRLEIIRIVAGG